MKTIAIFASGKGTNAEKIIQRCRKSVGLIVSSNANAGALEIAKKYNVEKIVLAKKEFSDTEKILPELEKYKIDIIVLAGFLWKIPEYLIKQFRGKIINIHPALLPKFGGRGMYGMKVHEAVIKAGEKETGITIHYVNENYDEGEILFQAKFKTGQDDTPETLAMKVQKLEHEFYPEVVERLVCNGPVMK